MLNANAKAFVPGGPGLSASPGAVPGATQTQEALYRYTITIPATRSADAASSPPVLPALNLLLSKRQLVSVVKGGAGLAATQQFVSDFFSVASNSGVLGSACGFLLSRDLLSLSAVEAVLEANEREGYILHLPDVPSVAGSEVGTTLTPLWETFFTQFGRDFRVAVFGYLMVHSPDASNGGDGDFRHYFFASTTPKKSQLVQLTAQSFAAVSKTVTEVKRVVPYLLHGHVPMAVVISFVAPDELQESAEFAATFRADCSGGGDGALKSLQHLDRELRSFASECSASDLTKMALVYVSSPCSTTTRCTLPSAFDVVGLVCSIVDSFVGKVVGIVADEQQWRDRLGRGLRDSWRFDRSASVRDILARREIVQFGPGTLTSLIRFTNSVFHNRLAIEDYTLVQKELVEVCTKPILLTRAALAQHADVLGKCAFRVRRRHVGVSVIVVVDPHGKCFCVDADEGNVVACSPQWSNPLAAPASGVYVGVLSASFRGAKQYRLVVHDLLRRGSVSLVDAPHSQRLTALDEIGLDDETTWTHSSPTGVVVLRGVSVALANVDAILSEKCEIPSCGVQLVCQSNPLRVDDKATFWWQPDETLTFTFVADELEDLHGSGPTRVRRAYLSCFDGGELQQYHSEFVDFFDFAAPSLAPSTVVECMLRRTEDGQSHWWELLRDCTPASSGPPVSQLSDVEAAVHSRMLTSEELKWLANLASIVCVRCHVVSEAGRHSDDAGGFLCRDCWERAGYGDCVHCGGVLKLGSADGVSERFYCDTCWQSFLTPRPFASGAPPPPRDASLSRQVLTRVVSILIDRVVPKGPSTDVLELCCGGSVVRKWIASGVVSYIGIDKLPSAVDETVATIRSNRPSSGPATPTSPLASLVATGTQFEVRQADAFHTSTWTSTLANMHPSQFHVITCFSGFHGAFSSEERARDVLFAISNALVPNGLFLGAVQSANALLCKGRQYSGAVFQCCWEEEAVPTVGCTYTLRMHDEPADKHKFVVPLDMLVAIGAEFHLVLLREQCMTFSDVLAEDDKWTRALSPDEKEYFATHSTFAFRKAFQRNSKQSEGGTPTS